MHISEWWSEQVWFLLLLNVSVPLAPHRKTTASETTGALRVVVVILGQLPTTTTPLLGVILSFSHGSHERNHELRRSKKRIEITTEINIDSCH